MAGERTHIESMVEKDYLGAWDVEKRDFTLTIEAVDQKKLFVRGGKTKLVPVVTFRGARKKFVLSARTNRDTITAMYGPYKEDWIGKSITLFMDPKCKSAAGGTCPGIRVRPQIPRGKSEANMPERDVDPAMRAAQGGTNEERLDEREPGSDDR